MGAPKLNAPSDNRTNLAQDQEFYRFLQRRRADCQNEADRLQSEIETLMAQVDAKRQEQSEYLNIVLACDGGLGLVDKTNRPAPTFSPHSAAPVLEGTTSTPAPETSEVEAK